MNMSNVLRIGWYNMTCKFPFYITIISKYQKTLKMSPERHVVIVIKVELIIKSYKEINFQNL